jgi:phage tail sheath protein FI
MRIADGATAASVTLKSESSAEVLKLTARNLGLIGESIRAVVTYNGQQPEATFNLELFRWANVGGALVKLDRELWSNLSMNPLAARYAPTYVTQNSALVDVTPGAAVPAAAPGYSQSGRPIAYTAATPTTLRAAWAARLGTTSTTNRCRISVAGAPYVDVDLSGIDVSSVTATNPGTVHTGLGALIKSTVEAALPLGNTVDVTFVDGPTPPAADGDATSLLRISAANGDVYIQPAANGDLAASLMLGAAQGGLEVGSHAAARPAANGLVLQAPALIGFAARRQDAFNTLTVGGTALALGAALQTVGAATPMYKDANGGSVTGNNDGVREKLALLQAAVNEQAANDPSFKWRAEVWGSRLAILPVDGGDNEIGTLTTAATDIGGDFLRNVTRYSVGTAGIAGNQTPAPAQALDGNKPKISDYAAAYVKVDEAVDLFNLLLLPADAEHDAATRASLWGPASAFCRQRRAFLIMDAPQEWKTVQAATSPSGGVNSLRVGLVKDHSALYYPGLIINDNGLKKRVGPAGAIAGLMARTDSARGVWKAPAGTEADLRGIAGLDLAFSDQQNGVLNPRGINTLRVFANGIVNWGARTMDGDDDFGSEWKYVPVRRLALFIEESLYRGTQWVVFEPNDEPLWAQIRLNVGAFMNNLFRQGAFQGATPRAAYFVKCDSETTTQNDINLGVVNILVGFAPLKPAEFVIIQLQQIAGQIQA